MVRAFAAILIALVSLGLAARAAARGSDAWSDALVHADAARALGYTGKGVTVAILDTGIDDRSPGARRLRGRRALLRPSGRLPRRNAEVDGPGSAQDDQGHGTAIADILAGRGPVGRSVSRPMRRSSSSRSPITTAARARRRSQPGSTGFA